MAKIKYNNGISDCDLSSTSVIIIGQLCNLNKISYNEVKIKIQSKVTEEVRSHT